MGLIVHTKVMNERKLTLQPNPVYDMATLRAQAAQNGLRVITEGGFSIKPFAHFRMMEVLLQLGADVMDGLFVLGSKIPQLASEIWVEAEVDDGA